ncbi:AI-2E family transporter [Ramlibacter algicola]|uniref:AI-2E family transporter n=1 Tax=Ramlibacter algicola TaxID=2795217 RepID=A0A934PWR7_9BURK|nr:AI-2E family transporter [Ramlibacter algicola]MBK0391909.1 AI-2E family transporter [Ramlibacter algicola]
MTTRAGSAEDEAPAIVPRRGTALAVLAALLLALHLGLFVALVCTLAVQALHAQFEATMCRRWPHRRHGLAALLLTIAVVVLLVAGAILAVHSLWAPHGLPGLLNLLADTLERLQGALPAWLAERLPASVDDLQRVIAHWLRGNAHHVQHWGHEVLRLSAQALVGLIIGLLASAQRRPVLPAAWMAEVGACWRNLVGAFSRFVGAQLRIAVVNTVLTGGYLLVALPLAGVHVPLAWTLVAFTLVAAFIPIVGNLASNAAILLAALTVSAGAAAASLVFLVAVHKLEYFLNAHFVGARTNVPAPVLLAALLVMEAAFGLPGVAAAPIYCAWVFRQFGDTPAIAA